MKRGLGALILTASLASTAAAETDYGPPRRWKTFQTGDALANTSGAGIRVASTKNLCLRQCSTYIRMDIMVTCGMVRLSAFEFLTYGDLRLRYRFDNEPIEHYAARHMGRGQDFSLPQEAFLEKIKSAKSLRMEVMVRDGDSDVIEFDVSGGAKALTQVRCAK